MPHKGAARETSKLARAWPLDRLEGAIEVEGFTFVDCLVFGLTDKRESKAKEPALHHWY